MINGNTRLHVVVAKTWNWAGMHYGITELQIYSSKSDVYYILINYLSFASLYLVYFRFLKILLIEHVGACLCVFLCVFLSFRPDQMEKFCLQIYMRCFFLSWISRSVTHFHFFCLCSTYWETFYAKRPLNDWLKQDLPWMSYASGEYCRCIHEGALMEIICFVEKENKWFYCYRKYSIVGVGQGSPSRTVSHAIYHPLVY